MSLQRYSSAVRQRSSGGLSYIHVIGNSEPAPAVAKASVSSGMSHCTINSSCGMLSRISPSSRFNASPTPEARIRKSAPLVTNGAEAVSTRGMANMNR
jgi:hypothetical protein